MEILIAALALILLIYTMWIVLMIYGWYQKKATVHDVIKPISFSLIIPFRNESDNILKLVQSLKAIDFDSNRLEIILVNDHSTDSFDWDESFGFKLLNLPDSLSGKKQALTYGIEQAQGDVIITTDADCTFHPEWVKEIEKVFQNDKIKFAFGLVRYEGAITWLESFQQLEFAAVMGVGVASYQLGAPIMCNGANLAFRKNVFLEQGGYLDNIQMPSGDDEYLMHKVRKAYPTGIGLFRQKESIVDTRPVRSLNHFLHQRRRWASKWKANFSGYKTFVAVITVLTASVVPVSLIVGIQNSSLNLLLLTGTKILFDSVLIAIVLNYLGRPFNLLIYLLSVILYPAYTLMIALQANVGSFEWKGRIHKLG